MTHQSEENYGTKIKELRIQMGLTHNQVAEELNVTPGYISNVENNRTAMSLRVLTYYAKLVGMSLDSLVGQVEKEYKMTALDNNLMSKIAKMSINKKIKLLKTLELWENEV
jgi:transcriptional regulator with XRE-family HTH domain